jgi:hypothetical protein
VPPGGDRQNRRHFQGRECPRALRRVRRSTAAPAFVAAANPLSERRSCRRHGAPITSLLVDVDQRSNNYVDSAAPVSTEVFGTYFTDRPLGADDRNFSKERAAFEFRRRSGLCLAQDTAHRKSTPMP